jgi:hypothetical protein
MWAEIISRNLNVPADFGIGDFPAEWTKASNHTGPEGSSPLKAALVDKTQSALYSIYSAILIWTARRLEYMTDVKPLDELAVALFCYQHDPDYLTKGRRRPRLLEVSGKEKYEATVLYFEYAILYERWSNSGDWPLFPNFSIVADAINLSRHHMGSQQRAVFDPWVEEIIGRMNILAPLPQHADFTWDIPEEAMPAQRLISMGKPIPPQALDMNLDIRNLDMAGACAEFLRTVDWKGNRFLARPEEIEPRFTGLPYRDPR